MADPRRGSREVALLRRMVGGASGPLLSFVVLFALPLAGAMLLNTDNFAFWAILSSVSSVALSLDFGGLALVSARYFAEPRLALLLRASALSATGAVLVSIIAMSAWAVLSTTALGSTVSLSEAMLAIAAIGLASAFRSILMVLAQAGLISNRIAYRNVLTAGHAVFAAAITIGLLVSTRSYWALPLGWLISGVALLVVALVWSRKALHDPDYVPSVTQEFSLRAFATMRTLTSIVASLLLQGDRWIVGALGGPALLAVYEVAWRFANLPRFLLQNLAIRVGADSSALEKSDEQALFTLLWRATRILLVVGVVGSGAIALAYMGYSWISGVPAEWGLFAAMTLAFLLIGLTSTFSFAGVAVGRASIDLPYALFALAVASTFACVAWWAQEPWIFIFGYLGSLGASVGIFFAYAPSLVRKGIRARSAADVEGQVAELDGGHS